MSGVEREFIDHEMAKRWNLTRESSKSWTDILGLNVYPVVDSFYALIGSNQYFGITGSQSHGA